jgi:preprotein translocase subunit SecA
MMRIPNSNATEYTTKISSLFAELDYSAFQEQATLLVNQYHDELTKQQWVTFCKHLNEHPEKKAEKFLLMQLTFHCLELPLTSNHLAQFITLSQQLKEVYGLKLFRDLMEANVPASDRQLSNYLTIFQLLIEMNEMTDIAQQTRKQLPNLQQVLAFLYAKQNEYIKAKYPRRNIDTVLDRFAQKDELNQFPLKRETLTTFKPDFLAIETLLDQIKPKPQGELREQFLSSAKRFREHKSAEDKQRMIAILMETIRRIYKILPYDTQLIAFLALISETALSRGRIAQVKAGEGKSTIFAMLVAFKAAQGFFVDLITSSSYLAIRDYEKYRPFLLALGLSSSHISYVNQQQTHFHAQILYGTNADFEFAFLRDGLNKAKLRYSFRLGETQLTERTFDVIFIDEVDNMMLDATGAARMAIPGTENKAWVYKPILDFVKNEVKNQRHLKDTVIQLRSYLQENSHPIFHAELAKTADAKLLRWLESAQIAYYQKMEKRDYLVEKDIVIVDYANTGRTNEGCQWQHGIHQFLQVKHGLSPTAESLTASSVSHPTYFSKYKAIYGLTGTMGELSEREEIKEIYAVDSFDVPPHLPCQRTTLAPKICQTAAEQTEVILAEINRLQKAGRPMLILFESIMESNAMSTFLTAKGITHQLLNETQRESEDYIIARAGEAKRITIATNTAGRGTDILLSQESKEAGGLHQIFTFYPENSRVEEQGVCRGGRQGQPGSCGMILQMKDRQIMALLAFSPKVFCHG